MDGSNWNDKQLSTFEMIIIARFIVTQYPRKN